MDERGAPGRQTPTDPGVPGTDSPNPADADPVSSDPARGEPVRSELVGDEPEAVSRAATDPGAGAPRRGADEPGGGPDRPDDDRTEADPPAAERSAGDTAGGSTGGKADDDGPERPDGVAPLGDRDPARVGAFELIGRIGAGGMGAVFLGKDTHGRLGAVKLIRPEYAADPSFLARFHDEVALADRVAPFCTAQVLEHGVADHRPYLVTEYVEGLSLERQVLEHGALPAANLHGVAVGVAAGLTAIHTAGLVHRDLKPANVILSWSGPRVIDFGIARAMDAPHGRTQKGIVLGSPGWMSPEQLAGAPVTPASDVFNWGCLVAFAGLGRHPYGEADPVTMAGRMMHAQARLGDLEEPLRGLVIAALSKDPGQRPDARQLMLGSLGRPQDKPKKRKAQPIPDTRSAVDAVLHQWRPPAPPQRRPSGRPMSPRPAPPAAGRGSAAPPRPAAPPHPRPTPKPRPTPTPPPTPPPWPAAGQGPPPGSRRVAGPGVPGTGVPGTPAGDPPPPEPPTAGGPHRPGPPGPGPAGPPGPAPKSRFPWWWPLIALLVLLFLLVPLVLRVAFDDGHDTSSAPHPTQRRPRAEQSEAKPRAFATARIGAPAVDANLRFVVGKVGCGMRQAGDPPMRIRAKGQFCMIKLRVTNTGGQPRLLNSDRQLLFDTDGAKHPAVAYTRAALPDETLWDPIDTSTTVSGTLIFDIRETTDADHLVLHATDTSPGVLVRL